MNFFIKILKSLVIPGIVLLTLPIILSILNLFDLRTSNIIILIIIIASAFVSSFMLGKHTEKKGFISGLIMGLSLCFTFFILSLFYKNNYEFNTLIYYLIIILSTTLGSMLGIQKNPNKKSE